MSPPISPRKRMLESPPFYPAFSASLISHPLNTATPLPTMQSQVSLHVESHKTTSISPPSTTPQTDHKPSAPSVCHRTILARQRHQQFPNFEVHLLAFDSSQTLKEFLESNNAPIAPCLFDTSLWIEIRAGQLVAVCLSGDEEVSIDCITKKVVS